MVGMFFATTRPVELFRRNPMYPIMGQIPALPTGSRRWGIYWLVCLALAIPNPLFADNRTPGQVVGWGSMILPNVEPNTVFTKIAAGDYHSLAMTSAGSIVGWGNNFSGQTTVPIGLSNAVAIATGGLGWSSYNLVLMSNGRVAGWGWNAYNQVTLPTTVSNIMAIAAGGSHSLAITTLLRINSIEHNGQNPVIGFRTFAGQRYVVEYSSNLSAGNWMDLPGGNVQGNGQDTVITDGSGNGQSSRFYRIKRLP